MLRGFYISAIALSMIAIVICVHFANEISYARAATYFSEEDLGTDHFNESFDHYYQVEHDQTMLAGLITLVYFLFMEALYILSLVKLKTTTIKVLSIIGISLAGIMIAWDGLMLISPNSMSFDETAIGWIIFMLIMLGFSIVGLVHAVRKKV